MFVILDKFCKLQIRKTNYLQMKSTPKLRLSSIEKRALNMALKDVKADVYLYGSRVDNNKKGGGINILVIPHKKHNNTLELALQIQCNFFLYCEQKLDVLIYNNTPFCQEIFKKAVKLYE